MRAILLTAAVVYGCTTSNPESDPVIMGDLELGSYTVGYRTLFHYDNTRYSVPYSLGDGLLKHDHDPDSGRQFQINLWYPSTGNGERITFRHYVNLLARKTNFGELSEQKRQFANNQFIEQTNDLGGNGTFTQEKLDKLLDLKVPAKLNADYAHGKFPVVIFPNNGSPARQSIICEYLASHGYVVAAVLLKGRYSSAMDISTVGLETAVDDLEFVLGRILELPIANRKAVGLVANAIQSSVCVAYAARNANIKTLVSLEGGLPSAFEQRLLRGSVFYQPESITLPILVIYTPHPSIDPKFTFHLRYANKYYAHFPGMSEWTVLNYGRFDKIVPAIIGDYPTNQQRGFEISTELILRFLDQQLKKESIEDDFFDQEFLDHAGDYIDTTFVLKAVSSPPNIAEMKDLFLRRGFKAIDSVYQGLKGLGNPQPFSTTFIQDFRIWLSWEKDEKNIYRHQLYELAFEDYPESSLVNYYLGLYSYRTNNQTQAINHYTKALRLFSKDNDPLLVQLNKTLLEERAKEVLQAMVKTKISKTQ